MLPFLVMGTMTMCCHVHGWPNVNIKSSQYLDIFSYPKSDRVFNLHKVFSYRDELQTITNLHVILTLAGMPAALAYSKPLTPATLEMTSTISAALLTAGFWVWSIRACRFVPGNKVRGFFSWY
jgi:hypothetical protein